MFRMKQFQSKVEGRLPMEIDRQKKIIGKAEVLPKVLLEMFF